MGGCGGVKSGSNGSLTPLSYKFQNTKGKFQAPLKPVAVLLFKAKVSLKVSEQIQSLISEICKYNTELCSLDHQAAKANHVTEVLDFFWGS